MQPGVSPYTVSLVLNVVLLAVSYILSRRHRSLEKYLHETEKYLVLVESKIRLVVQLLQELEEAYRDGNISPEEAERLIRIVRRILGYNGSSGSK